MSTHTLTYQRCDGCGRATYRIVIVIAESAVVRSSRTLDLCETCAAEQYICRHCWRVYGDTNACAAVRARMEQ